MKEIALSFLSLLFLVHSFQAGPDPDVSSSPGFLVTIVSRSASRAAVRSEHSGDGGARYHITGVNDLDDEWPKVHITFASKGD